MRADNLAVLSLVALVTACRPPAAAPPAPPRPPVQFDGVVPPGRTSLDGDAAATSAHLKVHLIDVGQGAATLLEFSCAAVLVDTGGEKDAAFDSTARLLAYLEAFFAARPDLHRTLASLWITHPHIDHTRGIKAVVGAFTVQHVVTNGWDHGSGGPQQAWLQAKAADGAFPLRVVARADVPPGGLTDAVIDPVACDDGDPALRALWGAVDSPPAAWSSETADNANNHSVVLRVDLGQASLLITGDLEEAAIGDLLALHAGTDALDVDVYEVGHHGSHNGTTAAQLAAISPRLALIPAGAPDRQFPFTAWAHGHPRRVVLELLDDAVTEPASAPREVEAGIGGKKFETMSLTQAIYASGWDGTIVVDLPGDGASPAVTTE